MSTGLVALDPTQYVRVNSGFNTMILQAHRDSVRVVVSELQPARSNTAFHLLGGDLPPQTFPFNDVNMWALAMSDKSSLVVTELKNPKTASVGKGGDFYSEVALGLVPGATSVPLIFGTNRDVSTSFVDVSGFGNMTFATVGESWEIVSTSVNDSASGTGLRTVLIQTYADDFSLQLQQIVNLDGTTPVVLTGTHIRTRTLLGAAFGSTGKNEGVVTLRVAGGGATRAQISFDADDGGDSSMADIYYTVPAGSTAQVLQLASFSAVGDDFIAKTIIRNNQFPNSGESVGGKLPIYQNSILFPFKTATIPEKFDFWVQAKTNQGVRSISSFMEIVEFDNELFPEVASLPCSF